MTRTCILLMLLPLSTLGQQVSLQDIARTSAAQFASQQAKAKEFAALHRKPLMFQDENGNIIKLSGVTSSGLPTYLATLNAGASITTDVDQLRSGGSVGLNLQGAEMIIAIWDGGNVKDHIELGNRMIAREGGTDNTHSTHVAGTLIATGINPQAKGMAPLGEAMSFDFDNDEAEMAAQAKPDASSLLFSNHSYGTVTGWTKNGGLWDWTGDAGVNAIEDYRFGFYGNRARTIDQIASAAPYYTIVWAAGNDRGEPGDGSIPADCNGGSGYDCIIPESVAKNIITVGAVNKVPAYSNAFDVTMSSFSSWGPTDDGRIKPDVVGAGVGLFSLSASGTNTYTTLSGTSMATPNVAGSLMLLQELYKKLHGGAVMKGATLKALVIHTTREAGNFPGPDYSFGWGLVDDAAAARVLIGQDDTNILVSEHELQNDSTFVVALHPKANKKITATIAWTDVPGTPVAPALDPSNRMLVNDLDLRIVDDQGIEQLPWILDPGNPSLQAARGDNFRDNVEKIEFDLPQNKPYSLIVSHKGSLSGGSQTFSLVLSYESTSAVKTFYWVGDSGDWNDASHWSTTSGGPSALQVPGAGDRIVVDENSFDGTGPDIISLTANVACSSFQWLNSKPSGIAFNSHALTVTARALFATSQFSAISAGTLKLQSSSAGGEFFTSDTNLKNVDIIFDGAWTVKGIFRAASLQLSSGSLTADGSDITLDQINSSGASVRSVSFVNTSIRLKESSQMNGLNLQIASTGSVLIADSSLVSLQWQSVQFPCGIQVPAGNEVSITGNNEMRKIDVTGSLLIAGSNKVDTLAVRVGGILQLTDGTIQTLTGQTQIEDAPALPVQIESPGHAVLSFPDHVKLCFDHLHITNVDIAGPSAINAGQHSTIVNSNGWRTSVCADILFADFTYQYGCAGGLTHFTDTSSGNITDYTWHFGAELSHEQNPKKEFEQAGSYPVTLRVTGPAGADSVTRSVQVVPNSLPLNRIVTNAGVLTSFNTAVGYQWFKDGAEIPGETSRSTLINGAGVYFVTLYQGGCSVVSDSLTIAGVNELGQVDVYPNPAHKYLNIETGGQASVSLIDLLGRKVMDLYSDSPEVSMATDDLAAGTYILIVRSTSREIRTKVLIRH